MGVKSYGHRPGKKVLQVLPVHFDQLSVDVAPSAGFPPQITVVTFLRFGPYKHQDRSGFAPGVHDLFYFYVG